MRTEDQETLDLNAGHIIDEEKITINIDSRVALSAMHGHAVDPRTKFFRVANGSKIQGFRRQKDNSQGEERAHAADELPTRRPDQSPGISEQNLSEEEQSCV